ncbi:MAG TPA: aminotransferase class V-fold PLP-dependent enzyme, partial [Thermoanaerobaculia bacterium]
MKEHWLLDPDVIFLNHGSFGATPRVVLEAQNAFRRRMEEEPVAFLVRELEPLLDATRAELGKFVGASPADLAFVPNATTAVNAVLRSIDVHSGDELLVTSHEYNACRNTLDHVAERAGARVVIVDIPFPIGGPDDVVERISGAATDRTRLLLVDHVTSQTALVFPIDSIVREMQSRGIDTIVDGAHAPGMLPLDLRALGVAYYAGNLHKWVCAPKGAALLYVRDDRRSAVHPAITSHGANSSRTDRSRFHLEFDWTGTFDPTPWLAVTSALQFIPSLVEGGWAEVMRRNHELALRGRDTLCNALSIEKPAPDVMLGSMAALPLPDGASETAPSLYGDPLQDALFERFA